MINIKNFDSSLLIIDKKSCKSIDIKYIGYITMKNIGDYESIHSVSPLYLIVGKANEYTEGENGNKYLVFAPTDKSKEVFTKYTEFWNIVKSRIEKIDNKPGKCGKHFMKITFNADHNFPLSEILNLHSLTIVVSSVFQEDNKYYSEVSLDECLYEL